jgi:Protein of unknown function (DUF3604)/PPIC-type PPIASE domain
MIVRFSGGFDFGAGDARNRMPAAIGYRKGVPMGGDLSQAPAGKAPTFLVAALKDPIGANLDRIQVVKDWLDKAGEIQEKIYDVVWSGERRADPGTGKLPPVGSTVDVANATYTNTIGVPELITVYREALALGLDRDETIIRRRLRQKLEFVSEDIAAQVDPTEAQLEAFLAQNGDAFRVEPRYSFRHVFLSPSRRGATLGYDAERLLAALNRPGERERAEEEGDPFLLPFEFDATSSEEVKRLFGGEFAAALPTLHPGRWQGPIRSGYGVHLVLVERRVPGRVPALGEVRDGCAGHGWRRPGVMRMRRSTSASAVDTPWPSSVRAAPRWSPRKRRARDTQLGCERIPAAANTFTIVRCRHCRHGDVPRRRSSIFVGISPMMPGSAFFNASKSLKMSDSGRTVGMICSFSRRSRWATETPTTSTRTPAAISPVSASFSA